MKKKYLSFFAFLLCAYMANSQEIRLQKGTVIDSVVVKDSISQTFSLYLPKKFEMKGNWPVLFVFDMEGNGKRTMNMFKSAAEAHGYILALPNNVNDSLTVSQNIVSTGKVIRQVRSMFPISNSRVYTAGFGNAARFANLVPVFIRDVQGVLSIGASLVNTELVSSKNPFHFLAVAGTEDFNYTTLLEDEKFLNGLKFQNNILLYEGGNQWPTTDYLNKALTFFDLSSMAKGNLLKDSVFINNSFKKELREIETLKSNKQLLLAEREMTETLSIFRNLMEGGDLSL